MIIYLDQAKWIDLLKAQSERADGAKYKEALQALQSAVSDGDTIVPLSSAHYMETVRNPSYDKRLALAKLMINISRRSTIAPSTEIISHEAENAVVKAFEIDAQVIPFQIFGEGISHAFMHAGVIERTKRVEGLMLQVSGVSSRSFAFSKMKDEFEIRLLSGAENADGTEWNPYAIDDGLKSFSAHHAYFQPTIKEDGWHKGERGLRRSTAQTLIDYQEPIYYAMQKYEIDYSWLFEDGHDLPWFESFIRSMPCAFVNKELTRHHFASGKWEPNDLNDLDALSRAIPYSDVVITEKQWVSYSKKSKLDEEFDTSIISDVAELPELIRRR